MKGEASGLRPEREPRKEPLPLSSPEAARTRFGPDTERQEKQVKQRGRQDRRGRRRPGGWTPGPEWPPPARGRLTSPNGHTHTHSSALNQDLTEN
ncbi:hypothetical protein Zm00014a_001137 [Zea mays]|uniref:Uncharacterized protein n=1 Tax=Zea mays TaxID=4577 RepID=A0A3L6FLZ2_MAIZE|nr:hypothetical protein Zm00014a_001137 [Zea mays]